MSTLDPVRTRLQEGTQATKVSGVDASVCGTFLSVITAQHGLKGHRLAGDANTKALAMYGH